jgi:peptide/nickel transport system permease protein
MLQLIASRLLTIIPVVFLVATGAFFLAQLSPIDPAEIILGPGASDEQVLALRAELGLDRPAGDLYVEWLRGVLTGDFGRSLYSGTPVTTSLLSAMPVTLSYTFGALAVSMLVGIPVGILGAVKARKATDRITAVVTTVVQATPNFWLAQLIIILVAINLRWLPAVGFTHPAEDPAKWLASIAMPCVALGLSSAAFVARQTRSAMIGVLHEDHIRTALAKGLSKRRIILTHGLKNAAVPIVTTISFQAAALLGGSIVVEQLFGVRGIGALAIDAVTRRDPDVIQAVVVFSAIVVVLVNLALDLAYIAVNPKVRPA